MRARRGNVLVLVTTGMVALLGAGAMVADVGLAFTERTRQQAAVDAGAMAAVHKLVPPIDVPAAKQAAVEWVAKNGYTITPADVTVFDQANGAKAVTVRCSRPTTTAFAAIFGMTSINVSAKATAAAGNVNYLPRGFLPFAVPAYRASYTFGQPMGGPNDWFALASGNTYKLLTADPARGGPTQLVLRAADSFSGNYLALSIEGTGTGNYTHKIIHGADADQTLPVTVTSEPGKMQGPTIRALADRIALHGEEGRKIFLPLVSRADFDSRTGRAYFSVIGYASARLDTINPATEELTATFISRVIAGDGTTAVTRGAGTYTPMLIPTP